MRSMALSLGDAAFLGMLFSIFLLVAFGLITVRKLRKIPEVKSSFSSGFFGSSEVISVATSLAIPKSLTKNLGKGRFSLLFTTRDILYEHTTRFDRYLGRVAYWLFVASLLCMFLSSALDNLGARN